MTAAALAGPRPRRRKGLGLMIHQIGYEQLSFWRNPQSVAFTFVSPVLFVTLMGALFGSAGKSAYFGGLSVLQYYVPTIAAMSVLGSCYGQLAVALCFMELSAKYELLLYHLDSPDAPNADRTKAHIVQGAFSIRF